MTGEQANAQGAAVNGVVDMGVTIFSAIGGNAYVQNRRFKHDDIVVQETARDNRAFIAAGATALLLLAVVLILVLR